MFTLIHIRDLVDKIYLTSQQLCICVFSYSNTHKLLKHILTNTKKRGNNCESVAFGTQVKNSILNAICGKKGHKNQNENNSKLYLLIHVHSTRRVTCVLIFINFTK